MSEMCCTRLAARTIAQICRTVSSQPRHVLTIEKNLLNIDTASTCSHDIVNFGLLTAEICWRVCGTPANFNGFRVLAALLIGTLVVGVNFEQRAPPIFGRAAITLGIGPHSSYYYYYYGIWPILVENRRF